MDTVRFLVEQGAAIDFVDSTGRTPLMWALSCRHVDIANFLVDNGASGSFVDREGCTVLHLAAETGDSAILDRVIKRCPSGLIESRMGVKQHTPLLHAIVNGNDEVCKISFMTNTEIKNY